MAKPGHAAESVWIFMAVSLLEAKSVWAKERQTYFEDPQIFLRRKILLKGLLWLPSYGKK